MPSGTEAGGQQSQIQSTLNAGAEQISDVQEVEFEKYQKYVLTEDGSVFWSATGEVTNVKGSLHYATDRVQQEDQTIGTNSVILTSERLISEFNVIDPQFMWIGRWPTSEASPPLQVVFGQRGGLYEEANIWHYSGFAVYPAMSSQIIRNPNDLPAGPIVSNSLPIWLANPFTTVDGVTVPVYPSFLIPDNAVPPYVSAHIDPEKTITLQAAPRVSKPVQVPNSGASPFYRFSVSALCRDEVKLILYGFTNEMAWGYVAFIEETSLGGSFGLANSPFPTDMKRPQVEITTLAQKKEIIVEANYNQGAADAIARRYILSASVGALYLRGAVPIYAYGAAAQAPQNANGTVTVA
jgi:hypothetical protein